MQRRDFLAALAFATAACAQSKTGSAPPPRAPVAGTAKLDAFLAALHGLSDGTRKSPVNIVQIGDSHTANDGFSGRMRELMQQRFGSAGRGILPPGIPFRLYRADGVHVTAEGFEVISSFASGAHGSFGISGLRQHAAGPASMRLTVDQPGDLSLVELEFVGGAKAGLAHVSFDDGPDDITPTFVPPMVPFRTVRLAAPKAMRMMLRTYDGSVDMLSWRIGRNAPGVTWSNLGTIGATVALLERWDPAIVQAELAHADPALIVLAFGSNEGFDDTTDLTIYAARYRAAIDLLRNAAPNASLLLIGPPDGVRHPATGEGKLCPGGTWQSPVNLARIRQKQREIASNLGLFFWDWSGPMGGVCSMQDWAAQTPPLGSADHLHLVHAGYRRTAEALFADLMHDYDAFAADHRKD